MIDLTTSISESLLGKTHNIISPKVLIEMKQKENAALAMCGGLLGNCYLLAEIVENLMVNTLGKFKKENWYKQTIKQYLKKSFDETHITINNSIRNSPTNPDYMREVADAIYEILKPDLFKLNNAVLLELNKRKVKYSNFLADMITIDILLRYINIEYDNVLEYMDTIFKTFYDSWYHPARCEGPTYWWNKGMQEFAKKYVPEDLDLNNISTIKNGITIIQKRIHSAEIADAAKAEANQYANDGGGQALYEKSLEILGID